ncbi:hypothetical protein [Candidatus Poriferisodalis sp.]|uniref:hypothetical protein n=1 Tax=Candidatus Poriferisodalis sp. TaxID=3101277 RepID=UPI003B023E50
MSQTRSRYIRNPIPERFKIAHIIFGFLAVLGFVFLIVQLPGLLFGNFVGVGVLLLFWCITYFRWAKRRREAAREAAAQG